MAALTSVDLLILDDFALESMSNEESKDVYQVVIERTGKSSMSVASNRDIAEWLAMFDDVLLAQSAVDRFKNSAYDFVIEGESCRPRLKPKLDDANPPSNPPARKRRPHPRSRRRRELPATEPRGTSFTTPPGPHVGGITLQNPLAVPLLGTLKLSLDFASVTRHAPARSTRPVPLGA